MADTADDTKPCAYWHISLQATCPKCDHDFDVLDTPDFWDGRKLDIGESHTDRSRGIEIQCPKCDHEWEVDLEY